MKELNEDFLDGKDYTKIFQNLCIELDKLMIKIKNNTKENEN